MIDRNTIIFLYYRNNSRVKDLGETVRTEGGAEGECENSQAKGPSLDDTLESDSAPKKQFSVPLREYIRTGENLSGKPTEAY